MYSYGVTGVMGGLNLHNDIVLPLTIGRWCCLKFILEVRNPRVAVMCMCIYGII